MNLIENKFNQYCNADIDINEHLPTLKKYSLGCESIVEMGVRSIISTWAFLAARPKKLISIDIYHPNHYRANLDEVYQACQQEGIDFKFIQASTLDITIEETDLLFIDTLHTYEQLKQELSLHGNRAKKYLILHDTESFIELTQAIQEFIQQNKQWRVKDIFSNNNGLTVLSKWSDYVKPVIL